MKTALIFIHGWLGNSHWWDEQAGHFSTQYEILQLDLPRKNITSSTDYALFIKAAADKVKSENLVLVGHSMSGAYVLEASLIIPRTKAIIVVDTLKNLDQLMTVETANKVMFDVYRKDFQDAVENILPRFLFSEFTPLEVQNRLKNEFKKSNGEESIEVIRPLYEMDIQHFARQVNVPVIAINSDFTPTNIENNKKYFKHYKLIPMEKTGHYPMLEAPDEFNQKLELALQEIDK